MAFSLGDVYKVYVSNKASPAVFNPVKGQSSFSINGTANQIDTSNKDTGNYATSLAGRQDLQMSLEGILDLPDTNGLELLFTDSKTVGATRVIQLRLAPFAATDVIFECLISVGSFQRGYSSQEAVGYSIDMSPAEAPTVNDLS